MALKLSLGEFKKFGEIRLFKSDLCPPECHQSNGQVLAMVFNTSANSYFTANGLREKFVYTHVDTINPRLTIYILLATSVLLALIHSIAGVVWSQRNETR